MKNSSSASRGVFTGKTNKTNLTMTIIITTANNPPQCVPGDRLNHPQERPCAGEGRAPQKVRTILKGQCPLASPSRLFFFIIPIECNTRSIPKSDIRHVKSRRRNYRRNQEPGTMFASATDYSYTYEK